tara:strand:- start:2841 stop:3419 length:579 start_codon:yes stop_codon:yes gene_type:complete
MKQLFLIFLFSFSAISFSNTIEKNAEDGDPQAQFLFAKSLLNDDADKAQEYFLLAAFQGHIKSAHHLNWAMPIITNDSINKLNTPIIYEESRGIIPKEILNKIRKQGNQGDIVMQYLMWNLYVNNRGVSKAEAYTWLKQSAGNKNNSALFSLGLLYYYGYIVPLERDKGVRLIEEASDQGSDLASIFLKKTK